MSTVVDALRTKYGEDNIHVQKSGDDYFKSQTNMKSELNTLRNHNVGFKLRNGAPETGDCTCGCTNTKTKFDW
jgi:hypothetical protein